MVKLKPLSYNSANTVKFLCSYGGKIVPRHTDGLLRYSGGLTRFLAVDRSISFSELMVKLEEFSGSSSAVVLRCQLPDGDLETLVTIKSGEDLKNVIEEYDRASSETDSPRAICIRAVLSAPASLKKVASSSSIESDGSPRRFAAASICSSSPARRASSPTQSQCSEAGGYGGHCYSPPVGYPVGLKSEAAKLRYYPWAAAAGGRPRFPYRAAANWH